MTVGADARRDPWARVWRVLTSDRTLFVWLALLLLVALIAFWFPQAPRSVQQQDGGLQRWLTTVRPQLGRPADTLLALGVLTVARAAWFRLLVAGTSLTLFLRAFDAAQQLTQIPGLASPAAGVVGEKLTVPGGPSAALEAVRARLAQDLRWRQVEDHRLVAHRPWAHLGPLCAALGGLVILGGWLWTQSAGWELADLRLTEDASASIPAGGQTLRLEELQVEWGDEDTPVSASARFALLDGDVVAAAEADLDASWRWNGVTYRFVAVGPAVQARGEGPSSEPLLLQTAAHRAAAEQVTLLLPAEEGVRSFAAPDQGIVVQVAAEPIVGQPAVRLRAYQGREGELVADRVIDGEASLALNGSRFDFDIIPYAEVSAGRWPGRGMAITGAILAAAGVILSLGYRPRRIEVLATARNGTSELAFSVPRDTDSAWLSSLVRRCDLVRAGEGDGD